MVTGTADTPWGRDDSGGSDGTGATTGFGSGHGRLGGRTPSIRQGVTQVNGRLPPEVIQRIVRQNFGRFKLCYVEGLRSNVALGGTVTAPIVGYDTHLPQRLGLYRLLMATVYDRAADLGCRINLSAGAAGFKRLRGGLGVIEFSAVYSRHLPQPQRRALDLLAGVTRHIGEPLMRRFEL